MSIGKHISLEEARKKRDLQRFAKAHPTSGPKALFFKLLDAMARKKPEGGQGR